jgi:hypothetical protein
MNSSYSDDGRRSVEDGKGLSLQVEMSEKGREIFFNADRISEELHEAESELERRSTPPGTIGET